MGGKGITRLWHPSKPGLRISAAEIRRGYFQIGTLILYCFFFGWTGTVTMRFSLLRTISNVYVAFSFFGDRNGRRETASPLMDLITSPGISPASNAGVEGST